MTSFSLCKGCAKRTAAFNLLELLVVMGVIAVLAGLSLPAITGLSGAGNVNRATAAAASALELARQHAVAKNTYTWVILATDSAPSTQAVHIVTLVSIDGTRTSDGVNPIDLDGSDLFDLQNGAQNLIQLGKAESCTGARLADAVAPVSPPSRVRFLLPGSVPGVVFLSQHPELQRVVQFGPNGQARVSAALSQKIGMEVSSANARADKPANVAIIQIDGFTGLTRVMRP